MSILDHFRGRETEQPDFIPFVGMPEKALVMPEARPARDTVKFNAVIPSKPVVKSSTSTSISGIKKLPPATLSYANFRSRYTGGDFVSPEYDLAEIGIVEDVESFVRQAHWKKIALMFKEGFDFIGSDQDTIRYCKLRFAQIARATGIPTEELIKKIGSRLIRMSNAFLVKARKPEASGGKVELV